MYSYYQSYFFKLRAEYINTVCKQMRNQMREKMCSNSNEVNEF